MQGMIWHHHYYYPLKNQREKKRKYTENRLNNSSDQLYMQRTNNLTNKHKRCWKRKVDCPGTTTQKRFYDFTHVQVWRQPHLGQHLHVPLSQADMVTDEFRELNKETSKTLVERERKKKENSSARKERERARQRARERENARELKGIVPCDGVLAEERRRPLYCAGSIPPPPTLMLGFWKITT
jgi:hypothetical protein